MTLSMFKDPNFPPNLPADKKPSIKKEEVFGRGKEKENQLEIFREKFLQILEKENILERIDGNFVIDLERFQKSNFNEYLGMIDGKKFTTTRINVYNLLSDLDVVSKADYEKKQEQGDDEIRKKKLFYMPESLSEALDVEKIKNNEEHYLNIWDINNEKNIYWDEKIIAKDGERINLNEYYIAYKLFKEFGAKREDGILKVFDKEKQDYVDITYDWFVENVGYFGHKITKNGLHNFLNSECSNLLKKEILSLNDFTKRTNQKGEYILRKEYRGSDFKDKMEVMFFSVKYYIGRGDELEFFGEKFPKKNIKIVLLDKNTAGVVVMHEGRETLKYTFDLLNKEDKNKKKSEISDNSEKKLKPEEISARTYVNKKEIKNRLEKFSANQLVFKRKDEGKDEYEEKISNITDYSYVKKVSEKFFEDCKVGIHNDLSWKEQVWLASAVYELGTKGKYDLLVNFVKKLGTEGMQSFLNCETDIENAPKIITIGNELDFEKAKPIFSKISEITNLADRKNEELSKIIYKDNQKEISPSVRGELMRRAHNIISRFSYELKDGEKPNEEKIAKLLKDLEQSRIEIDLVASLLIAGKKEGEVQSLENIKGLEISEISGKEVLGNPELIDKLREMYRANNSHKSKEDLERLMSDFEKHLEHDAKFYLVYFDQSASSAGGSPEKSLDNLVGFMRSSNFDGIKKLPEGERYLGAMNIDPLLQKFYFGENFLRETVEKEFALGTQKIIAHLPKEGASHKIIKTLDIQRKETPAGNYKLEDGREIERILVELTKKQN